MAKKKTRLETLRAQARVLQTEILKLEETETDALNQRLVGKCFRYHNTYGSGDKWWLYARVTGAKDGAVVMQQFQTDCHGKHEIETQTCSGNFVQHGGYQEISRSEYDAALGAFLVSVVSSAKAEV